MKVFGGPVSWSWAGQPVTGTDVQVAIGLAAALPWGLDVLAEGSPLGERSLTMSAAWAF